MAHRHYYAMFRFCRSISRYHLSLATVDSLTHIAVGACIGELVAGKKIGKKAMILGAIGQSIPDIDFVASYWMPVSADLLAHRGFTHSLLFAVLITALLTLLSASLFPSTGLSKRRWALLWGIQLFMHLFLDIFNVYGTGLFEPFSHYRLSLNVFFVLDPLFSLWPVLALIAQTILHRSSSLRGRISVSALTLSLIYMLYSISNKLLIDKTIRHDLAQKNIAAQKYFSTPTALNNLLWYIVVQTDSGYYVGYRSVLDHSAAITYHFVPQNDQLLTHIEDTLALARLKRFSQGYYTATYYHDTLVFNDLRFGEMTAGLLPAPRFCFYYYLQPNAANDVIIQRGRFAGWNKQVINLFIRRIGGK